MLAKHQGKSGVHSQRQTLGEGHYFVKPPIILTMVKRIQKFINHNDLDLIG